MGDPPIILSLIFRYYLTKMMYLYFHFLILNKKNGVKNGVHTLLLFDKNGVPQLSLFDVKSENGVKNGVKNGV